MIVRASGAEARAIVAGLTRADIPTHHFAARLPMKIDGLEFSAWIYQFCSPRSVTGEDVLEIHLPGNALLARKTLEALVAGGARQAEPGEFTARAYFNARIDLAQAEGVAAVIAAQSDASLRAARKLLVGELSRRLRPAMENVASMLSLVEAGIDFSDEDISFVTAEQIRQGIDAADRSLTDLLQSSDRLGDLTHEPGIVLAGRPNAGKSTLLNALAGKERAVVSPIAGTTRDVLSAEVRLARGFVSLIDAAGIDDQISQAHPEIAAQMQSRAMTALERADVVVLVRDCLDPRPPLELPVKPALVVLTKLDLASPVAAMLAVDASSCLLVSAINGSGLLELRARLDTLAFGIPGGASLALNARHVQLIGQAQEALARAREVIDSSPEVVAFELREALDALGGVLGRVSPDDLLGRIFSQFCIGK
jgi:tRNA modification GTPase